MSEDRAEAMNLGPNTPATEAEKLREEEVAERINPGPDGTGEPVPEDLDQAEHRMNLGPDGHDEPVPEALDEAEHRMNPGPQG